MKKKLILENIKLQQVINLKQKIIYDVNNKLFQKKVLPPDKADLESLAKIIIETNRTTILEFGCGWSTLVFAASLKFNKKKFNISKGKYRRNNLFECHTVDASKKYLKIAKDRVSKYCKGNTKFYYSNVSMMTWNGKIATEYDKLPLINPDFIYIDAPSTFDVKGSVNGWNTGHADMLPMMCDILKIEHFLTPKTIIVIDGRAANARFIHCNLQRQWQYKYCKTRDQHFFVLEEDPLGKYSKSVIKDIYFKNGNWNINDL